MLDSYHAERIVTSVNELNSELRGLRRDMRARWETVGWVAWFLMLIPATIFALLTVPSEPSKSGLVEEAQAPSIESGVESPDAPSRTSGK
jgi:hypothetical protein